MQLDIYSSYTTRLVQYIKQENKWFTSSQSKHMYILKGNRIF